MCLYRLQHALHALQYTTLGLVRPIVEYSSLEVGWICSKSAQYRPGLLQQTGAHLVVIFVGQGFGSGVVCAKNGGNTDFQARSNVQRYVQKYGQTTMVTLISVYVASNIILGRKETTYLWHISCIWGGLCFVASIHARSRTPHNSVSSFVICLYDYLRPLSLDIRHVKSY